MLYVSINNSFVRQDPARPGPFKFVRNFYHMNKYVNPNEQLFTPYAYYKNHAPYSKGLNFEESILV